MKLEFDTPTIERSSEFESEQFSIGNVSLILDILRSKMYSSPVKAIIQEVASNARDANREVGKHDVPISIKLPNRFDPNLCIQDYGPGITPERMKDVVIKYGVSTKRDSNEETGGFGLGFKTPWSYTDSFVIISNTPEQGRMVSREYVAYIDETRQGTLSLLRTIDDTDREQGTTVQVAISPRDFSDFANKTRDICYHWEPRPEILGSSDFVWDLHNEDKDNWIVKEGRWSVNLRSSSISFGGRNYFKAILDGIPYEISSREVLKEDRGYKLSKIINYAKILLHFNVGEVSVSANRESLEYTDKTVSAIQERLEEVQGAIEKETIKVLEKSEHLADAEQIAIDSMSLIDLRGHKWNGITITRSRNIYIGGGGRVYKFRYSPGEKPSRNTTSLTLHKDTLYVLDDTDGVYPSYSRLYNIFVQNPGYVMALVFKPTSDESLENFKKNEKIEWLGYLKLSDFEPIKLPQSNNSQKKSNTNKCFVIKNGRLLANNDVDFTKGEGVWVSFNRGNIFVTQDNGYRRYTSVPTVKDIENQFGVTVYAIPERFQKRIGKKWISLEKFIDKKEQELREKLDVKDPISLLSNSNWSIKSRFNFGHSQEHLDTIKKRLKNDSVALNYIKESEKYELDNDTKHSIVLIRTMKGESNSNDNELKKFYEQFMRTYKLLSQFGFPTASPNSELVDHVGLYFQRIDDELRKSH